MGNFLKHPLTVTFFGFVLTGVLGALFTIYIQGVINEKEQNNRAVENRKLAVSRLSTYILERKEWSTLLISSFRRNADINEIKHRKRRYDEVYVKWNTHIKENKFLIREILDKESYKEFERAFTNNLIIEIFSPLDACLTSAYDKRMKYKTNYSKNNNTAYVVLKNCKGEKLKNRAAKCGDAISDSLYSLSKLNKNIDGDNKYQAYKNISKNCK